MAIYGIGAYYDRDVSNDFLANDMVGTGWDDSEAPELHKYLRSIKVGDIVYLKLANFGNDITVKGIRIIIDNSILSPSDHPLIQAGRRVKWISKERFVIPRPAEKNNDRSNTRKSFILPYRVKLSIAFPNNFLVTLQFLQEE
jgi:hypothetical protein